MYLIKCCALLGMSLLLHGPEASAQEPATNPPTTPSTEAQAPANPSSGQAASPDANQASGSESAPSNAAPAPKDAGTPPTTGTDTPTTGTDTPTTGTVTPPTGTEETPKTDAEGVTPTPPVEKKIDPPKEAKPIKKEKKADSHGGDGHVAGQFTIEAMWEASSTPVRVVLVTLLLMMIACFAVGIERFLALGTSRGLSNKLRDEIQALFGNEAFQKSKVPDQIQALINVTEKEEYKKAYLQSIMAAGLREFAERQDDYGIEAVERALEKIITIESRALGKGMTILATTGATAPFVGLVGTIFGIINAFSMIGSAGGGDLMTLAPAIGEALITTAFGIMVALVGVWIFNYFTAIIDGITNQMTIQSQSLIDWSYKKIAPPAEQNAAK
ncbi:MAG: MotA/TolQ/ExbB proton channel family protein [Myxococcota bacterium]|nr:MotA/TolQ/ExbB proton channel family protein [Myxococcota bacterium]